MDIGQHFFDEARVGLIFYGVQKRRNSQVRHATRWFILLMMPIFPIGSYRLRWDGTNWVAEKRIAWKFGSILRTYLWGWILIPLALLGPMFLCVAEIYKVLGGPPQLHIPIILLTIGWFLWSFWKILDWNEVQLQPPPARHSDSNVDPDE